MSGSALAELQSAVQDALEGDAALAAMITGVFDHVPPAGQAFPFVVLAEKSEKAFDTFSRAGISGALVLDLRSRAVGDAELLSIYDRIKEVLDAQPLALTGFTVVSGRTSLTKTFVDPDGSTRRAEARFEVIAQQA